MLEKTTEISKCSKEIREGNFSQTPVKPSVLKRGCKFVLQKLVVPTMWHWAIVKLPAAGEKFEWFCEKVGSFFDF